MCYRSRNSKFLRSPWLSGTFVKSQSNWEEMIAAGRWPQEKSNSKEKCVALVRGCETDPL